MAISKHIKEHEILGVESTADLADDYVAKSGDTMTGALIIEKTDTEALLVRQDGDANDVFTVDTTNRKIVVTSGTTGQSTIEAGLIINNASGGAAIDDFQVNSDTKTAILVDASAETIDIDVPVDGDLVFNDSKKIYLGTGSDFSIYHDGTSMIFDVDQTTDEIVFNEGGADTDFRIEGSGVSNALFIQGSDGNVGIGIAAPANVLDIVSSTGGAGVLMTDTSNSGTALYGRIGSKHFTGGEEPFYYMLSVQNSSENQLRLGGGTSYGNAATHIGFFTATDNTTTSGTEQMRIDSSGNVGIGITDPDTTLEVFNAGNQLKLSFDATDNAVFAVDTNGDLTITPSGTGMILKGASDTVDPRLTFDSGNDGYIEWQEDETQFYTASGIEIGGWLNMGGAFFPRQVDDDAMDATDGTEGEIVYNQDDNKFYGCTTTGTPATWSALN